ncbi:MAG: PQQ-binding-like beta-propeller repeat protein [Bacteriovoracia bacterium]
MQKLLIRAIISTLVVASFACSSRDIHKKDKFIYDEEKHPIRRDYVYSTRHENPDTGEEPVDHGGLTVGGLTPDSLAMKDLLVLATPVGGLEAIYRKTFQRKWRVEAKNGFGGQPLIDTATVYVGGNDGIFYAVSIETGKVLWTYETKAPVWAKPMVFGQKIFFVSSDDILYCLEANTGKWIWHYKRGVNFSTTIHGNSTPVVDNGKVYAGFSDGYIVGLKASDGNLVWEQKIHSGAKFTDVDATAVIDGETIYIPSYDGGLYALDKQTGKIQWRVDVGSSRTVLLEDKTLYVASSDGNVYSLAKDSGRIQWKFEVDDGVPTGLLIYENFLAFGSSTQFFYVVHKGNGALSYRYSAGMRSGFITNPVQIGHSLYILSKFGNLYVFEWKAPNKPPVAQKTTVSLHNISYQK